ncbi:MAG: dihydroxy-acid dehydratase, partial [Flavobacteriales bacterium]|nr:dihydroxy-acid dehydratase [Flavobacteriales bacterium]
AKEDEISRTGKAIHHLLSENIRPSDILTPAAFENALRITMVLGGSTNAVLHLIAMAHAADVPLTLADFQKAADFTPFLADLKPSGRYLMEDLHREGGVPAVMKAMLRAGMLNGDCLTVTGRTQAENLEKVPELSSVNKVVRAFENPIKPTGHIQILYGNIAPEGAVAKITGKEGDHFEGPARCYDDEESAIAGIGTEVQKGEVIVIRHVGPKGGPGMPEMLKPTGAVMGAGLGSDVALITDGRFSGGSHGFVVGHITPEAHDGGPLALIRDGDTVSIDARDNTISVRLTDAELAERKRNWKAPDYEPRKGVLKKYVRCVASASEGCITDK